jgi:hypothetical protein
VRQDYHNVGYSCNDLVFVFGYNCDATSVLPTLEQDVGQDNGYGWLSLEQSLLDHRDRVRGLIEAAPSYQISFPEETGTTILTQCTGHSKAVGKCTTRLPVRKTDISQSKSDVSQFKTDISQFWRARQ